jgi:transcription elongation GreA/GreB family factor
VQTLLRYNGLMSRAFVKESDQEPDALPERALSEHPNFVTARGLALLEQSIQALESERSAARSADDKGALARIGRDLRYYQRRRESARLITPAPDPTVIRFGVRVWLKLEDGSEKSYRIVGEDEADPGQGLLSYVSPLARALLGASVGAMVQIGATEATVLRLEV